jgi:hypothetical protein
LLEKEQSLESQNQELHKTNASRRMICVLKSMLGLIKEKKEEPSNRSNSTARNAQQSVIRLDLLKIY